MNDILQTALELQAAGISIIPTLPGGDKKPALPWKTHTKTAATPQQIRDWYTSHPEWGIAAISGQVSNGLIMIELEGHAAHHYPTLQDLAHNSGLGGLWDATTRGWLEQSPSGGLHWFAYCDGPTPPNQKLATTTTHTVLAETRGEGGYTIVAPTGPNHHHNAKPWRRIQGGPQTATTLTPNQLDDLLTLFRTLNEHAPTTGQTETKNWPTRDTPPTTGRLRPGDDYEAKTTWQQILQPQGWTPTHTMGHTTYWTRPGKDHGVSATTGNADDRDRLYVFTTSTTFQPETPYTKFAAYALLNHDGDHAEAAKQLAREGYGDTLASIDINLPTQTPRPNLQIINGDDDGVAITDGTAALKTITVHHPGDHTEAANAKYFADAYGQQIRYITDRDRWLHWDGHVWTTTGRGAAPIKQLAIQALTALPTTTKEENRFRLKSLNASGIANTLTLAATDPRVAISQDQLDAHPGELNTPTGIVNLHTGSLQPADPTRLHTRTTTTGPDPNQPTPLWDAFLTQTFEGHDPTLTAYVQQLAGYAATGYVTAQNLPFLHGPGANGKSVLTDVIMRLLGDYAEPAPANFLMQTQQQHPTEVARLQGARLVVASEVPEGARFDEVKVKQLTGGDMLAARYMHGDFFTFKPTHKLWLLGNHQPKVQAGGYSFWRRLRLIPFTNIVPEHKRIGDLADRLVEEEGAGILAWIIQGATSFLTGGLVEPAEVLEATKDYEDSEDALGRFVADRVKIGGGRFIRVTYKTMRYAWTDWCRTEGLTPASANAFTRELASRFGIETVKINGVRYYINCTLLDDADEPENETVSGSWDDLGGGVF